LLLFFLFFFLVFCLLFVPKFQYFCYLHCTTIQTEQPKYCALIPGRGKEFLYSPLRPGVATFYGPPKRNDEFEKDHNLLLNSLLCVPCKGWPFTWNSLNIIQGQDP
jgi:hypothetical protein